MKTEKGITLISLSVYIIAMLITVSLVVVATGYFEQNIDVTTQSYDYLTEFTKFESYMSKETNIDQNEILEISQEAGATQVFVAFSSGNQYTYIKANKAIYQNNVKIASEVEMCTFEEIMLNGHEAIKVTMQVKDKTRIMNFTLKNW